MRSTYKALTLSISLLTALAALPAQANDALMRFAANNEAFDQRVTDAAKDFFRRQIEICRETPDRAVRQLPTGYGNITFPPAANSFPAPTSGLWAEHVKLRACNKIWQINILAIGQNNTNPLLLNLLPGDTNADPASQRSAERIGAAAIKKADQDSCADNPTAMNTHTLGYKQADGTVGKTDAQQGWFEQWDYKFCQKTVPVQLAFTPDGSGGYDIKARLASPSTTPQPAAKPVTVPAPAAAASPAGNAANSPTN